MKVSLFTNYGALNSKDIFKDFEAGLIANGEKVVFNDLDADVAVIWSLLFAGRMKENSQVWSHFRSKNKPVVVIEVGTLRRNISWRIGINGINRAATWIDPNDDTYTNDRFSKFGRKLKPWKNNGEFVVIATQRPDSYQWNDMPPVEEWVVDKIEHIKEITERPIVIRPHPRDSYTDWDFINKTYPGLYFSFPEKVKGTYDEVDFQNILDRAHIVINHSSNPAVDAIIDGIPVISSPDSFTWDVSTKIENIENPNKPPREEWAEKLAYCDWFMTEIAAGIPWSLLKKHL